MKYIRTKKGIIPIKITKTTKPMYIKGKGELIGYWGYDKNDNYVVGEILIKDIIKQADTIKELCDAFVLFDDKSPYTIYTSYEEAQRIRKNRIEYYGDKHNMIIYGAIWTERGLIYVAKMNDKGELELL